MADSTPEEAPEKPAPDTTEIPAEPTDDIVTTQHTLTVKRKKLAYTAKAGRIVLRKEVVKDGKSEGFKAKAEVFITSYTLDDADPGSLPVTFAFNRRPGSLSQLQRPCLTGPPRVLVCRVAV